MTAMPGDWMPLGHVDAEQLARGGIGLQADELRLFGPWWTHARLGDGAHFGHIQQRRTRAAHPGAPGAPRAGP